MTAETWAGLPESTRWAFKWLARECGDGFTGTIRLECKDGGVSEIRPTPVVRPSQEAAREGA